MTTLTPKELKAMAKKVKDGNYLDADGNEQDGSNRFTRWIPRSARSTSQYGSVNHAEWCEEEKAHLDAKGINSRTIEDHRGYLALERV